MKEDKIGSFLTAIRQNDTTRAKQLFEETPSLADAQTEHGISLLLFCVYYKNMEMATLLAEKKSTILLFEACALGDTDLVRQKLEGQTELLHQAAPDGFYLLGFASFFGRLELVKFLVEQGAAINQAAQNNFKVCPIHSAVANGHYEIAEYLLSKGADVNVRQMKAVTALHSAAHQGRLDMVKLLLANGADLTARTDDGKTALMMAIEDNHEAVVAYLREQRAKT